MGGHQRHTEIPILVSLTVFQVLWVTYMAAQGYRLSSTDLEHSLMPLGEAWGETQGGLHWRSRLERQGRVGTALCILCHVSPGAQSVLFSDQTSITWARQGSFLYIFVN